MLPAVALVPMALAIINRYKGKDGWTNLGQDGTHVDSALRNAGISFRELGFKKLKDFMDNLCKGGYIDLEIRPDVTTPDRPSVYVKEKQTSGQKIPTNIAPWHYTPREAPIENSACERITDELYLPIRNENARPIEWIKIPDYISYRHNLLTYLSTMINMADTTVDNAIEASFPEIRMHIEHIICTYFSIYKEENSKTLKLDIEIESKISKLICKYNNKVSNQIEFYKNWGYDPMNFRYDDTHPRIRQLESLRFEVKNIEANMP